MGEDCFMGKGKFSIIKCFNKNNSLGKPEELFHDKGVYYGL